MNNKKIVFRVTREYMKKNKMRTRITFAGIFVMVVLMTAVFVGKDTLLKFLTDVVAAQQGKWHAIAYDIGENELNDIKNLSYVEDVGITRTIGYTEFPQSGNPENTPYLEIKGYTEGVFDRMNIRMVEGRYPENENEIIISKRALDEGADIQVGDKIEVDAFERYVHAFSKGEDDDGYIAFGPTFMVAHGATEKAPAHFAFWCDNDDFEMINEPVGYQKTCEVVGIMEMPYYESKGMGGYIAITGTSPLVEKGDVVNAVITTDLTKNFDLGYDLNSIINNYRSEEELAALEESGSAIITDQGRIPVENGRVDENDALLVFAAKGSDGSFNKILIFLQVFFIILITVASLVLIYNVFSISYRERCKYLGMLSSVGATRAQKRWSVYYEVFILLVLAIPVGILAGLLLVKFGMMLLYPHFIKLLEMVAENVILQRNVEIGYRLVIRPLNILFVLVFSTFAVGISAWLPAKKVAKIGPIESIRGTEKVKEKKHKTNFRSMKKGQTASLLSHASVSRSKNATFGIIRSITAFIVLTLVTGFASNTIIDIVNTKTEDSDFTVGREFEKYDYLFYPDDEALYEEGKDEILHSDDVSEYEEIHISMHTAYIPMDNLTDHYYEGFETILSKYFPDGIPEDYDKAFLHPVEAYSNPTVHRLIVDKEHYAQIAKRAGADPAIGTKDAPGVMVYNDVFFDTDQFRFDDAVIAKPNYTKYELSDPIRKKVGEKLDLFQIDFQNDKTIPTPVTFAGYVKKEDLEEYAKICDGDLWIIISDEGNQILNEKAGGIGSAFESRFLFFNTNEEDCDILRKLATTEDEYGNSVLCSAHLVTGTTTFKKAIGSIVRIVAICFSFLIAIMSLLNLYNSVVGRRFARQKELMVLQSIGMTKAQKAKMLILENVRLLAKSFIYGGIITAVFVVLLHWVVSHHIGRILFSLPVWMIAATILTCIAALFAFTAYSYRQTTKDSIVEGVRNETV